MKANCPNDEEKALFELPSYVSKMVENGWLGSKTNQGFYKKVKNEKGKSEILTLDLNTLGYRPAQKAKFATLEMTKSVDDLKARTKMLFAGKDRAGEFYRKLLGGLFAYVSNRLPEISDDLFKIDDALKAGFGWEIGPFETWDIIGVEAGIKLIEAEGRIVPSWVK